jgi:hypothetical protein
MSTSGVVISNVALLTGFTTAAKSSTDENVVLDVMA